MSDHHPTAHILESITDPFYAVDAEWRLTYVNQKAGELWNRRPVDIIGSVLWDIFPNYQETQGYRQHLRAMETRLPVHFETYSPNLRFWAEVAIYPMADGGLSVYFRNITEKKRIQEALQLSEERFRLAAKAAKLGSYWRNFQTGENHWSPEFLAIFGLAPGEELPLKDGIPAAVHPEDREKVLTEAAARLNRTIDPEFSSEHRIILTHGNVRWVMIRGLTEFDAQSRPLLTHGFAMDITDQKQTETALRELNRTLEQRVEEGIALAEARSRQLQSLAVKLIEAEEGERRRIADLLHDDLQQLLAGVRLQLQAANRQLPENRVLGNVDQLLEAAIEQARSLSHELSPSVLHHSGLVPALQWLVRKAKEQFGLTVELETAADRDFSSVPLKEFLFRVVQELLFNAFKHAGVTTARVHLSGTDDRIIVTVSDGGKGFDPAILHSPTARSGLGLLSIRERVHSLGGDLHIESAPGSGSRFTLTVPFDLPVLDDPTPPLAAENRAAPAPTGPAPYEAQKTIRVLFADDHQVMRQGLISMIEDQPSIEVVGEATDGLEALELTRQLRPDLVVMDITMPEMDGLEATHHITREMPEVRVVGLSMYEEEEIRRAMRDAGAESFVSKTASPGDLLKAIYGMDRTDP